MPVSHSRRSLRALGSPWGVQLALSLTLALGCNKKTPHQATPQEGEVGSSQHSVEFGADCDTCTDESYCGRGCRLKVACERLRGCWESSTCGEYRGTCVPDPSDPPPGPSVRGVPTPVYGGPVNRCVPDMRREFQQLAQMSNSGKGLLGSFTEFGLNGKLPDPDYGLDGKHYQGVQRLHREVGPGLPNYTYFAVANSGHYSDEENAIDEDRPAGFGIIQVAWPPQPSRHGIGGGVTGAGRRDFGNDLATSAKVIPRAPGGGPPLFDHFGGFQVQGGVAAVALMRQNPRNDQPVHESQVWFIDVSEPNSVRYLAGGPDGEVAGAPGSYISQDWSEGLIHGTWGAAGMTQYLDSMGQKRWLVLVGWEHGDKDVRFYRSEPCNTTEDCVWGTDMRWRPGPALKPNDFFPRKPNGARASLGSEDVPQNAHLITGCDGTLYVLTGRWSAVGKNGLGYPNKAQNRLDLFRLEFSDQPGDSDDLTFQGTATMVHLDGADMARQPWGHAGGLAEFPHDPSFRAGSGPFITASGQLNYYAIEWDNNNAGRAEIAFLEKMPPTNGVRYKCHICPEGTDPVTCAAGKDRIGTSSMRWNIDTAHDDVTGNRERITYSWEHASKLDTSSVCTEERVTQRLRYDGSGVQGPRWHQWSSEVYNGVLPSAQVSQGCRVRVHDDCSGQGQACVTIDLCETAAGQPTGYQEVCWPTTNRLAPIGCITLNDADTGTEADIRVTDANYGDNCGGPSAHVLEELRQQCAGMPSCTYSVSRALLGDPCPGTPKDFSVSWSCGGSAMQMSIPGEAVGQEAQLICEACGTVEGDVNIDGGSGAVNCTGDLDIVEGSGTSSYATTSLSIN